LLKASSGAGLLEAVELVKAAELLKNELLKTVELLKPSSDAGLPEVSSAFEY
jgi:hypothetical protein